MAAFSQSTEPLLKIRIYDSNIIRIRKEDVTEFLMVFIEFFGMSSTEKNPEFTGGEFVHWIKVMKLLMEGLPVLNGDQKFIHMSGGVCIARFGSLFDYFQNRQKKSPFLVGNG